MRTINKATKNSGYSLMELLMVMAVIGIVGAIAYLNLLPTFYKAQLRQASGQLAVDLELARGRAQRLNQNASVVLGTNSYSLNFVDEQPQLRTLPPGVRLERTLGDATITYTAPYGETDANPSVWSFRSDRTGNETRRVRIIGVTGKVIEE